jgi:predicted transcriptional regulator
VTGPAVLSNKTREQIYLHIQEKPGSYYRAILRDLDLAHGTLSHHLYRLERERLIRRQRHGLRLRFFPTSTGVPKSRPVSPWQMRVLETVRGQPQISQSELARILGLTRQALHYHIDQLRRSSLIGVTAMGRETHLAVDPNAWARLGRCPYCGHPFEASSVLDARIRCPVCNAEILRPGSAGS